MTADTNEDLADALSVTLSTKPTNKTQQTKLAASVTEGDRIATECEGVQHLVLIQ